MINTSNTDCDKENIIIIDDDNVVQMLLTRVLTLDGYRTFSVRSAEEALIALEKDKYDAMILDIELPGMSGIELLDKIPDKLKNIAVIFLTAHGSLDSAIKAIRFKASDYLLKPIKREDVLRSVEKAINGKKLELADGEKLPSSGEEGFFSFPGEINPYSNIIIDFNRRMIFQNKKAISLTLNEVKILSALIKNEHHVILHSDLVRATQGYKVGMMEAAKILRPVICRLREKLEQVESGDRWIQNIRGTGYLLEFPR